MSSGQRPRQVTMAGWMIMVGSAAVVFSAFERVSDLRSLESQEAVAEFLSEPPGDGLGLTVDQVLELIRVLSLVAAASATAAAILGFYVLRRSKQARLALAVLSVPLLVTGIATGGIVSSLVVAAAVMLWLQPARNWFEGKPPPPSPVVAPVATPETPPTTTPSSPAPSPPATPRLVRPPAVVWACVITWTCAGVVLLGLLTTVLVLLVTPDLLFDELHRQNPDIAEEGLSDGEIEVATYVMSAIFVPWCIAAAVFAAQAYRRVKWGRRALQISAAIAGGLSLVGMFASTVMLLPFVAAVLTISLLSRPEVRHWYDAPPPDHT